MRNVEIVDILSETCGHQTKQYIFFKYCFLKFISPRKLFNKNKCTITLATLCYAERVALTFEHMDF